MITWPITIISVTGLLGSGLLVFSTLQQENVDLRKQLTPPKEESVGQFINALVEDRAGSLPPYKKKAIASAIERVGMETFENERQTKQFAVIVAIESGFNVEAKSKAGAVGLTQVMPQYAATFMSYCGIPNFKKEDLSIMELNLKAGACAFKQLLQLTKGNVAAALVAYNAGTGSSAYKSITRGGEIANNETANYPTKYMYLMEKHNK